MRVFIYIILFFLLNGALLAQTVLEKKVSLSIEDLSMEEAIYALTDEGEVNIAFNNDILDSSKRVTLSAKNQKISDVLDTILKGTNIEFIINGDRIILKEQPPVIIRRKFTISGYLLDAENGEPLIGAVVQDSISQKGTFANTYGFYSLTLEEGKNNLKVSYLGYQPLWLGIDLNKSTKRNFELEPAITLQEIVIYASEDTGYDKPLKIGVQRLQNNYRKSTVGVGGEQDLIKLVHNVPGVQTGADGFGGMTVRGGNVDQNLVLLDGVPVYNYIHALGIYSIFNGDAVRSTKLLRGVFPARYGGRISSVVDVRTKEGNNRKFSGSVNLAPLSIAGLIEGPIKEEKSAYLVSFRRSLIDLYSVPIFRKRRLSDTTSGELSYYFYDFNAKVNFRVGQKDKFYFSFYTGKDKFSDLTRINVEKIGEEADTTVLVDAAKFQDWGNVISSMRWNHTFSNKLFANTTLTYTRFFFENIQPFSQISLIEDVSIDSLYNIRRFNSNNEDLAAKVDFDYHPSSEHHLLFGLAFTKHKFQPRIVQFAGNVPIDTFNSVVEGVLDRAALRNGEYALYIEDEWRPNTKIKINPGVRFSYIEVPQKAYQILQPRLLMSFEVLRDFYLLGSAGYVVQPVHLLTTTGRGRAEDLWVGATSRFKPIESKQISTGFSFYPDNFWSMSIEAYWKDMKNIISFQEGLVQNIDAESWQNVAVSGEGLAKGIEFSIAKNRGKFTMAMNYTVASALRQFASRNSGEEYRDQFDRRHNFNISMNRELTEHFNISTTFVYQSGALTTVPQASYYYTIPSLLFPYRGGVLVYEGRSNVSLPPYHRLDIGGNLSYTDKPVKHYFKFGIYNVYNRQNPSFYNISSDCQNSETCYKQTTLVPIMPYFKYKIKF